MKAWILAAVVAGALVLVGVPTVALAVASHSDSGAPSASAEPKQHDRNGPASHGWGKHHQSWGQHGFHPGRHFKMHKLTAKQRDALADRLDQRASQLRKSATCLRQESDAAKCFKRFFSPPQQRG
jgi:Spy/CpxP family protein refolding chaperone